MKVLVLVLAIVSLVMIFSSVGEAQDESLILYCPFEEGEGDTTEDVTGNNEPGTLNAGVEWVDGKYGKALSFNGVDGIVEIPDSGIFDPENLTVEMWLNPNGFEDWPGLVTHGSNLIGWYLQIPQGGGGLYFATGQDWGLSEKIAFEKGEFQHLAVTYDGKKANFFLDGELMDTIPKITIEKYEGSMIFGRAQGGVNFYNGILDEVAIYSRVLTQEEIMNDMSGNIWAVEPSGKLAATWGSIIKEEKE